ncbi:MAG: YHS domain-containing protein [Ignavibacteriae bacterium]|nr:YHS domain-containing protein [Ignavibacteriota bacterium]
MVRDIVCGMGVEEDDPSTFVKSLEGKTYYFCSDQCMLPFMRAPDDYIKTKGKETEMVKDLVCGMEVDENNPPFTSVNKGKIYYFCSNSCKREFERNPKKYLK